MESPERANAGLVVAHELHLSHSSVHQTQAGLLDPSVAEALAVDAGVEERQNALGASALTVL
jgi:hypothetical protein